MNRSHYQVHADVRRVFARHWVDLDRLQFGVYRDMLRVSGELHCTRDGGETASAALLEVLSGEMMRIREIRCVQFDFANWKRDEQGAWKSVKSGTFVIEDAVAKRDLATKAPGAAGG